MEFMSLVVHWTEQGFQCKQDDVTLFWVRVCIGMCVFICQRKLTDEHKY